MVEAAERATAGGFQMSAGPRSAPDLQFARTVGHRLPSEAMAVEMHQRFGSHNTVYRVLCDAAWQLHMSKCSADAVRHSS